MELDKVIDSAVLDAGLTSVADAIRAKGGTSEQLVFPEEFVSAVEGIQVGGGDDVIRIGGASWSIDGLWTTIPDVLRIELQSPMSLSIRQAYETISRLIDVVITYASDDIEVFFGSGAFSSGNKAGNLRTIDCGGRLAQVYPDETFRCQSELVSINAILYLSDNATFWDRTFVYCYALEEIRFLENSITVSGIPLGDSNSLSDDSLISIANALVVPVDTTCTVTLHATSKARCDEILGTVSAVTDGDTTYDFFTQDETGTVTLTEFITTTKGWTLA